MANVGLTIRDNPDVGGSLSLADTLAKGIFRDPEQQMKARALAAQVQAHQAYATKLAEDTREEQTAENERLAAGPLVGNAAAAAVPAVVPTFGGYGPSSGTGYGPQPGIVDADAVRRRDALVARERALGPILVRGNPTQVAEGVGKDYGGAILSGAAANPAIVNPDTLRIAGGLYTGTAPSTSTVWSAGDISGQQAEAGKDIAVARAKPPEPKMFGDQPYTPVTGPDGRPMLVPTPGFQPTPKAPERQVVDGVVYERQPNGAWALAQGITPPLPKAPERQVVDGVVYERDQTTGKWEPAQGIAPPAPGEPGAFGGQNSLDGVSARVVSNTSVKMQDQGYKPTLQEATDYATGYNHLFQQPKQSFEKDAQGNTVLVTTMPEPPAGVLTPAEVYARAGIKVAAPPAAPPGPVATTPPGAVATTPPGPVAAPPGPVAAPPGPAPVETSPPVLDQAAASLVPGGNIRVQKILAGGGKTPTESQSKDRTFVARALMGTTYLDQMKKGDLPDVWSNYIADPSASGIVSAFLQSNLPSDTRSYITARTAFGTAQLRNESGAAINPSEFRQTDTTYNPVPGDGPAQLAQKTELRHAEIRTLLSSAYAGDPEGLKQALQQAKELGVDLTPHPERLPAPASARNAKPPAAPAPASKYPTPPAGVDPKDWEHVPEPDRAKFF